MTVRRWLLKLSDAVPRGRRWRVLERRLSGVVLLGAGLVLLILPGPGIPFVVAGLVLLEWDAAPLRELARRWLERLATLGTSNKAGWLAEAVIGLHANWPAFEKVGAARA